MRIALIVALGFLTACAGQKLALAPPPGVDFSGHWQLNEADSDDPLRLTMSQLDTPKSNAPGPAGGQGGGGRGGRGGGGPGGPGGSFGAGAGPLGPTMPGMGALRDGLQWPGKELEVKQVAGVVAITSAGVSQTYQPAPERQRPHHKPSDADGPGDRDMPNRDMPSRDRGDGPPAACGWEAKTLVIQPGGSDGDGPRFEQRYSVSADGQRLIEVVAFKGGRSGGYTVSRVWDRVTPEGAPKG
jgi:hypothetical protein